MTVGQSGSLSPSEVQHVELLSADIANLHPGKSLFSTFVGELGEEKLLKHLSTQTQLSL